MSAAPQLFGSFVPNRYTFQGKLFFAIGSYCVIHAHSVALSFCVGVGRRPIPTQNDSTRVAVNAQDDGATRGSQKGSKPPWILCRGVLSSDRWVSAQV